MYYNFLRLNMVNEKDFLFMWLAEVCSKKSQAKKLKVGCVIEKDDKFVTYGYNKMPYHMNQVCEIGNKTKLEVIHAEEAAIVCAARIGVGLTGATLYVTHSPCAHCASLIVESGITRVVYKKLYKKGHQVFDGSGVELVKLH